MSKDVRVNPLNDSTPFSRPLTRNLDVIIVGAGVKGLYCARLLRQRGFSVIVLEKSGRVGGKIFTHRSPDLKSHVEFGAMRILDHQHRLISLIKELNVDTETYITDNGSCPFVLGETRGLVRDMNVQTLMEASFISQELLSESELKPTTSFQDVLLAAFHDVMEDQPHLKDRRALSVAAYLTTSFATSPKVGAICQIALKILDLRNGVGGMHHIAKVYEFVEILKLHSGEPLFIKNGTDEITKKLVSELNSNPSFESVQINSEVISVDTDGTNGSYVNVTYIHGGTKKSLSAKTCLLACPSLHKIKFQPSLPSSHQVQISRLLDVQPALKIAILFSDRFWERPEHGKIVGGVSLLGPSLVQQVHFPQIIGSANTMEGYLLFYLRGPPASHLIQRTLTERQNVCIEAIESLFPEVAVRELIRNIDECAWDNEGSKAYFLSGANEVKAALHPVDRLVFSPVPRGWINDAITDGADAVDKIISILEKK